MADLNLSLEIAGSTTRAVDELGRMKAAVDQVGQSSAKQAEQMQAAGQAGAQAMAQLSDRARAANEVLRQLVQQGKSFDDAFESARRFAGTRPTVSTADLGVQAQAHRADQVARARTLSVRNHPARGSALEQFLGTPQGDAGGGEGEGGGGSGRGGLMGFLGQGQGAARFAAGLVGVNLGLSVASTLAQKVHGELVQAVDTERALELGARSVGAAYGAASKAIEVAAHAFTQDPSTKGSQAEALQAAAGMSVLTKEYALDTAQVIQLTTAAGQLAKIHGTDLPSAAKALQGVMQGNTSAATAFGVSVVDQLGRIRGLGATYEQLVQTYGKARAEQMLLAVTLDQVRVQGVNTRGQTDQLATAMDRLAKATSNARDMLGGMIATPGAAATNWLADLLGGGAPGGADRRMIAAPMSAEQQALDAKNKALINSVHFDLPPAPPPGTTMWGRMVTEIDQALAHLKLLSEEQSKFNTLTKAVEGGSDFPNRLAPGQAAQIGGLRAVQDIEDERARAIAADKATAAAAAMRQRLTSAVTNARTGTYTDDKTGLLMSSSMLGPNSEAAKRAELDLSYFDQRATAQTQLVQAQHEELAAQRALSVARREDLAVMQDLASVRLDVLSHGVEERSIQRDLNSIDDRRVSLAREEAVLRARSAELPAGRRVQDLQREEALLLAQAHLHPDQRAAVAGRLRDISLHGMPEAQYADLLAQGPVIAAQRAQEDADIARQIRLSPTRLQQINLDAILQPLQDKAARLAEAQELVRLGATPEEVRAEMARRAAEDAQRALIAIPSPSAAAAVAGVGAGGTGGQPIFNITVSADGTVTGPGGTYGKAAQAGGSAFWSAFNDALSTTALPPDRPMLGGADNLLEP